MWCYLTVIGGGVGILLVAIAVGIWWYKTKKGSAASKESPKPKSSPPVETKQTNMSGTLVTDRTPQDGDYVATAAGAEKKKAISVDSSLYSPVSTR
jgi:hypothetical protein